MNNDEDEEKANQKILDTGDGESGEDVSKFSEDVSRTKEEYTKARLEQAATDNDMVEDLIEAGTWGLAESHAMKNPGHSVVVIQDKSFDNPDQVVIRVACNGSPDLFLTGVRECEYWQEVPIP
jgi:hypothetical protein